MQTDSHRISMYLGFAWSLLILILLISGTGELLFGQDCQSSLQNVNTNKQDSRQTCKNVLFEDNMMDGWQENWFLDGQKATLDHRDEGLYFSGGSVTKLEDPEEYHAHHAVLWTKQVFEGDLLITYQMTRVDSSDYGTTLLYIQAQGTGKEPYVEDIVAWRELRDIPAMSIYWKNMNLISLSFRENLRCKRYPWEDHNGERYLNGGLIEPMLDYGRILPGKSYRVEVEKRTSYVTVRIFEVPAGSLLTDHTWDLNHVHEGLQPVTKGRIGLRHMSTRQFIYKNFLVKRL